jgi:hypothetical protein
MDIGNKKTAAPVAPRFERVMAWAANVGVVFVSLLLLAGEIDTGAICLALPMLLLTAVIWPTSLFLSLRQDPQSVKSLGKWARRLLSPAFLVIAMLLIHWELPFRVAFLISQPAMDRLAQQVIAAPAGQLSPGVQRVGLFTAAAIEKIPTGIRFASCYGHPFDYNGFAFSSMSLPSESDGYHYEHYRGNWYLCWRG